MTSHPGPESVDMPATMIQQLIDHARAEYPNEACGIIAGSRLPAHAGAPTRWFPARNDAASPLRYTIHPQDLLRIYTAIDDVDEEVWAIVHSHVRSPARPSPTDIGKADSWPDALYILVSLAESADDPGQPSPTVRAWRIVDREVFEVSIGVIE